MPNLQLFNIKTGIEEITEILEDKVNVKAINIDIKFVGFNNEYTVKTDSKRMQQVLLNLYSNAIKFTNRNGNINIKVEKIFRSGKNMVLIKVIDDGIGIKAEDQRKLFKLFGSMKDEKKKVNTQGIGLGLVISKLIVEKFGGKLNFLSENGKGTTFYYTFPLRDFNEEEKEQFKESTKKNKQTNSQNNWILQSSTNIIDVN